MDIRSGERVLDIGTGTGYTAAFLAACGSAVTTVGVASTSPTGPGRTSPAADTRTSPWSPATAPSATPRGLPKIGSM
ncbi:hypothetical protein [Embleya sp. NBC_00888]|uniref:hypothetical protein n=1 Tax=Embleya sp. NBC_00888 TaxID=2975960 RepID=UPI00386F2E61